MEVYTDTHTTEAQQQLLAGDFHGTQRVHALLRDEGQRVIVRVQEANGRSVWVQAVAHEATLKAHHEMVAQKRHPLHHSRHLEQPRDMFLFGDQGTYLIITNKCSFGVSLKNNLVMNANIMMTCDIWHKLYN